MNRFVTIFCFLSIFYSVQVMASVRCQSVFISKIGIEIETTAAPVLTPLEYQDLVQQLTETARGLKAPLNYRIIVSKEPANDVVDHDSKIIYTSAQFPGPSIEVSREAVVGAFAHEFGHAIFETNLKIFKVGLGYLKQEIINMKKRAAILEEDIKKLAARGQRTKDKELEQALFLQAQAQLKNLTDLRRKITIESDRYRLFQSLHELFADITAVVLTQDPQCISKAVVASKQTKDIDSFSLRDFSISGPETINRWNTEKYLYYLSDSSHVSLTPARWAFWEASSRIITDSSTKTRLLKQAFNILLKEWETLLNLKGEDLSPRAYRSEIVDAINQRLSEAFQENLSR